MASTGFVEACGCRCPAIYSKGSRGFLFLHGYRFRGDVWADAERFLRGFGWSAPDMPYGLASGCSRRSRSTELNVCVGRAAAEIAGLGEYVVVGASMGARYALGIAEADERVVGVVLVGPALGRDPGAVLEGLRRVRGLPVLVVRGLRDRVSPHRYVLTIASALGARVVEVEGAGHVVHRDRPEVFYRLLLDWVSSVLGWSGEPS